MRYLSMLHCTFGKLVIGSSGRKVSSLDSPVQWVWGRSLTVPSWAVPWQILSSRCVPVLAFLRPGKRPSGGLHASAAGCCKPDLAPAWHPWTCLQAEALSLPWHAFCPLL